MSISTTPPAAPPPKKKGLGCLGCGCLILALLAILLLGLAGGIAYWFYTETLAVTTTTPSAIPSSEGSDALYQAALRKIGDFDHAVTNHQPATITLSADEINVLISNNPALTDSHVRAFVTLSNHEGRLQANIPSEALSDGFLKGRYADVDASFEVHLDSQTKSLNLMFHAFQLGNTVFVGPNSDNKSITAFSTFFNQTLNRMVRNDPANRAFLDQARLIEIQNGQLVITTP